jgi:hypothetical protein
MEENQTLTKKTNYTLIILVALCIILVGAAVYFLFIKDKTTNKDTSDNTDNTVVEKDVYKTKDGKFTLRIVDKEAAKAKKDYEDSHVEDEGVGSIDEIKYYAYFNDSIIYVSDVFLEDEHYVVYEFGGYKSAEAAGYTLVLNKDTNTLEINPEDLVNKENNCMEQFFCSFTHRMSFVKTDLGYFFVDLSYGDYVLYTTSWKKLGYVYLDVQNETPSYYKLKEVDSTGVTAYSDQEAVECFGNECTWKLLNPTKYDVNGNVVNN